VRWCLLPTVMIFHLAPVLCGCAGRPIAKATLRGCEVPRAWGDIDRGQGRQAGNLSLGIGAD